MISFPFDSEVTYEADGTPVYDRGSDSSILSQFFGLMFSDGVFATPEDGLLVTTSTNDMSVTVRPGNCMIQGHMAIEAYERTLVFEASGTANDRIDAVVARLNINHDYRDIDLYVIKGTEDASPVPPALTRVGGIYEIRLANVYIPKNTSIITTDRITDTRKIEDECGTVSTTPDAYLYYKKAEIEAFLKKKQDASTAITTGNIGNQSVKHATTAGRADYAHLSDYLKVINTDWNGFFDDNAYARVRYDGKYIRFDADMGGTGVGSACSYADSATYASKMKVIKQDWSGELDGAYGILYYNGTHLQLMGSDGTKTVYAKCNYADSAGTAVDQTARDSAANANNNANGRLSTSGGTISGNLSVGGNLTMGRDIYMGNHSIFSLGILQGTSTLHLRTPDKVTVENEAGNANMNLLCSYLHCVGVVNTSYREAKENIIQVSEETARKILDVPIFKFDYRPGFGDGKKNVVGTIVDEVQNIIPEAVNIPEDWDEDEFNELLGDVGNKDTPGVDYVAFVPYLIAMVQLQQKEIDELKQKVTALENKN